MERSEYVHLGGNEASRKSGPFCCCQFLLTVIPNAAVFVTVALVGKYAGLSHNSLAILLGVYFGVQTLATFILAAVDKGQAASRSFRVAEIALFVCSFFCGFLGLFLAMLLCCHKVKKDRFVICSLIFVPINAAWLLIAFLAVPFNLHPGEFMVANSTNASDVAYVEKLASYMLNN